MGERELAQQCYGEAVEEFREAKNEFFPAPDWETVDDFADVSNDFEQYKLTVHTDDIENIGVLGPEYFKQQVKERFEKFHSKLHSELTAAAERDLEELREEHPVYDKPYELVGAFFQELSGTTIGEYVRAGKYMLIDSPYHCNIDLKSGRVTTRLRQLLRHENAHLLHFQHNPHAGTLLSGNASEQGDYEYKKDIRNASLEAITRFEQYHEEDVKPDTIEAVEQAVRDSWELPTFMEGYLELQEYEKGTITDPYILGHFTALSVFEGFKAEKPEEEALDLTRDFLFNVVTTPNGLKGVIENSYEKRDVPNYPEMLESYAEKLSPPEILPSQIEGHYTGRQATRLARPILTDIVHAETESDALEPYLEGAALLAAYKHQYGDQEEPEIMEWLEKGLEDLQEKYR